MRLGLRARVFLASFVLILSGGGAAGLWLGAELSADLEDQAAVSLTRAARAAEALVRTAEGTRDVTLLDRIAGDAGAAMDARITLIAADGTVLGDSEFDGLALAELDSHAARPEVVGARRDGTAMARRYSRSLQTEMMYVAVAGPSDDGVAVVRAARRLSSVKATIARVRLLLIGAGAVLVVFAVLMSALASWLMARATGTILDAARAVAAGDRDRRIPLPGQGDLAELAASFNQILDDLQGAVTGLAAERDRVQAVLDGMSEPVLAVDPDHVITLCNGAAVAFLMVDAPPIGQRLEDVLPSAALAGLALDAPGEAPSTVEFERHEQRFLAQATRRRDGGGTVVVLRDITGIRRLEKMRRDFVANVSHELRTPVAVLQANAETLLDGALEEAAMAERLVEAIHRQTMRLGNIVGDLLDISRIEAGQYRLDPEPQRVLPVLDSAVETLERPAATRETTVVVRAAASLAVMADPKALEQIVTNLLDNAIKYSGPGGTVTLRARPLGDRIRLEIEDDGPGIPRKHHARLFERFYRVDKGRSRGMGGTGLGLSIVKHLAEAMHGRVGYAPVTPHGSVFWLDLPAAPAIEKTDPA